MSNLVDTLKNNQQKLTQLSNNDFNEFDDFVVYKLSDKVYAVRNTKQTPSEISVYKDTTEKGKPSGGESTNVWNNIDITGDPVKVWNKIVAYLNDPENKAPAAGRINLPTVQPDATDYLALASYVSTSASQTVLDDTVAILKKYINQSINYGYFAKIVGSMNLKNLDYSDISDKFKK